ncbi:hypothetical protein LOD99_9666 [Oopsacas minuta]|uniref:PDZ domain-containing protein n=1 Tax=Oopsacas minuta TaxID=111878 RepID=A0AAV7KM49_9METZ|nr:hypothetical protein LOD99_9666 [Oopsacas minuta]
MSDQKRNSAICLSGLEDAIDILLQQNLHRNIHTTCCIISLLQEYITYLLPIIDVDITDQDRITPDTNTAIRIVLELDRGEHSGVLLGYMEAEVENRVFIEQIAIGSKAEEFEEIEIDHIILEINSHPLSRCSLERAQVWLESAERGGKLEMLLSRSISIEREIARGRVYRAIDKLSLRLSEAAVRRASGVNDLEALSRVVRTLAIQRHDPSDANRNVLDRENTLHIMKGRDDIGIILSNNGGNDHVYKIESIAERSAANRDGRLQTGDVILKVNGVTLAGLTNHDVMELLNVNRSYIQIVLDNKLVADSSNDVSNTNSVIIVEENIEKRSIENENSVKQHDTISPHKPPIPDTNWSGDHLIRESSLEYPTWSRLSQRSYSSENSFIGTRNSPMRSSFQVRHVALSRSESKPLGFTIAGGKGSRKGDIGIFVGHIHDNGAASQEGTMKIGDEILEVNGMSLEGMSQRKALQTFKKLKQGLVTIKLKSRSLQPELSANFVLQNVILNKTADAGLGLELIVLIDARGGYLDGIYVQNVREGSVAFQDGSLKRGDQLLTINGDPLMSTNLRRAHAIIGTLTPGEVDIGIRRYSPVEPLERLLTLTKRQNRLQPIPSQQSMRLEPRSPSYQADASSIFLQEITQLSSDASDNDDAMESDLTKLIAGIERANSFTRGAHGSETALRMSREELEGTNIDALFSPIDTHPIKEEQLAGSDSEETMSDVFTEPLILSKPKLLHENSSKRDLERLEIARNGYSSDIVTEIVTLHRSMGQTLGMNVIASSTPQLGVLVTSILKDGPAAKQARIRVGDELLEINNTSLIGLTQSKVLSLLSSLTGEMNFKVIRTPDKIDIAKDDVREEIGSSETRKLDQVTSSFPGYDMLELTFSRHTSETLGITLSPSKGQTEGYLQIRRVLVEGLAHRDGRLKKFDRLYALDSAPLYKRPSVEVMRMLRQTDNVFTLIILREVIRRLANSETSLTASSISVASQGLKKGMLLKTHKYAGSFEDSLKDIRSNDPITSVHVATKLVTDIKPSMDGISGYNSEFTNITPASSEDYIDNRGDRQDQEEVISTNQQSVSDNKLKGFNPKRVLFRKRHLVKTSNLTESIDAPPHDARVAEERRTSFVQQTSSMSVTGELPRQLVFTGSHLEKQSENREIIQTKNIKKIKFRKMFKIIEIKLSEVKDGQVSVSFVATSSPLRRTTPPLEIGDVLININGTPVTSKKQAEKLLYSLEKGEHTLEVISESSKEIPQIVLKEEHQENTEVNKNNLQTQENEPSNNQYELELIAKNKQELFGLEFGDDNQAKRICITSISPLFPGADSRIQIGDQLISIDGKSFVGISLKDGNKIYENLPINQPVLFILQRTGTTTNQIAYPKHTSMVRNLLLKDRILEVELDRGGENKLGVVLSGGSETNEKRVYIRRIGPGSIVATDGRLKISDELISVNGISLEGLTHKDALLVIKNAGNVLNFKVFRRKDIRTIPSNKTVPSSPSVLFRGSKRFINLEESTDSQGTLDSLLKRNKLTSTQGLR